jgi:DNA modification methylase
LQKEATKIEKIFRERKIRLSNEDCMEMLKIVPDKSIDLILTDPPYNISKYSTGNINLPNRSALNNNIAKWDLDELDPKDFIDSFKRIIKPTGNIFIFTSYNMIGKWHEAFDKEFDTFQYFIWHKTNPPPKIYKNGFLNSCEMIVCMWNKGHKWNFTTQKEMHNFFESPICMGKERLKDPKHPTQKPIKLLEHIIKIASNENDVVLDPFMGVASTAIAALNLNRMFAGCEIDESYYEASVKRVLQHMDKNRNLLNFNEVQTLKEDGANYIDDGIDW